MISSGRVQAGAWIDASTGAYAWIDGFARWVDLEAAVACLRLPPATIQALGKVPWDLTANAHPEALTEALVQGMIRVRLGDSATFETTIPVGVAVKGAFRFMSENLDPRCLCRFNNLNHAGQSCEFRWDKARAPLRKGDLTFLTPSPLWAPTLPPVPEPWLLLDLGAPTHGLGICRLDPDLPIPALLKVVRPHVGPAGGWLGLPDGRKWRLEAGMPPLVRVGQDGMFKGFEVCPDCGWPRQGEVAPCMCWTRAMCRVCSMPIHWPPPVHETITLRGEVLHVPHTVAYAHKCISWSAVQRINFETLQSDGRT